MAEYRISGVWKDASGTITHYAFHLYNVKAKTFGPPSKTSKKDAINLLGIAGNSAKTTVWNYAQGTWHIGEDVYIAGTGSDKYLKSKPDTKISDNLGHLIRWNSFLD